MLAQREKIASSDLRMVERWETLASRVKQAQAAGPLHHMLATMRTNIKVIHDRLLNYDIVVEPHLLDDRINRIAADIAVLNDRKTAMLALNVSTHRLITDLGASAPLMCTTLKDGVADLYRIYDETFQKCNQQLRALQDVQQFGTCLAELQSALQRDKESLAVLDVAVQAGATPRITSSVSYYARLLSEKQDINCQNDAVLNDATTEEMHCVKFAATSASNLTQEGGSLSDSGISDGSGSEQELSKREHRLANLRRIRRNLEAQLGPGSKALVELWKRYEDAESDLRNLQEQCRELVVRTAAANMDTRATKRTAANQIHYPADKRKKASDHDADMPKSDAESVSITKDYADVAKGDNPDSEPIPRSWVWRIFKCSKSCCFVLVCLQVVLMCVEYFLKPNCCETTLSTLLSPTWSRDPKGLPPV